MNTNIFISYRRDDEPGFAHAMHGELEKAFSQDQLFMDVDAIPHGKDFVKVLEENLSQCQVLLAIIGKGWLAEIDENSKDIRLNDPNDFVRMEIASALKRDIDVIPVLVNEAVMPSEDVLPDNLKVLTRRNAIRISHDRFRSDMARLIGSLKKNLGQPNIPRQRLETDVVLKKGMFLKIMSFFLLPVAMLGVAFGFYRFLENKQYGQLKTIESGSANVVFASPDHKLFSINGSKLQRLNTREARIHKTVGNKNIHFTDKFKVTFNSKFLLTSECKTYSKSLRRCTLWEAKVWDANSLRLISAVEIPKVYLNAIALLPDGKSILASGCDNWDQSVEQCHSDTISQWETSSGKLLRTFKQPTVWAIEPHPDGISFYVGGSFPDIRQINLSTGENRVRYTGLDGSIYAISVSPDGTILVAGGSVRVGSSVNKVGVWGEKNAGPKVLLDGHPASVKSVNISPDGALILSVGRAGTARLWKAETGELLHVFRGHNKKITSATFADGGKKIVTGSDYESIRIWDARSKLQILFDFVGF